jgi:hypothetical protein
MTAIASSLYSLLPITTRVDEEAGFFSKKTYSTSRQISEVANILRPISIANQYLKIWQECLVEGWDGYDAKPVEERILENLIQFVDALDKDIPIPELCPEPDGEIAVEWYGKNKSTISISIGVGDIINYAAIFPDQLKANGTDSLKNEDKTIIEFYIKKVLDLK